MRVSARNQRQVYAGYVNEQGHRDTEEAHPKPPIAVGAFPIGTMNMRFMMVTVHDFIHSYPAFLGSFRGADNRLKIQELSESRKRRLNKHISMQLKYVTEPTPTAGQVCSLTAIRSEYRRRTMRVQTYTPNSSISSASTSIMPLRVMIPCTLVAERSLWCGATRAKAESVERIEATTFQTESSGDTTT